MTAPRRIPALALLLFLPLLGACTGDPESFADLWFDGQAELNRYKLTQFRYGESHKGHAVLIFVTEDFLPDRQVKSESGDREVTGAVPVMKLNFTKRFTTGIYPYSVMTSSFLPLHPGDPPNPLKVTASVQEWCGQVFSQMNFREGHWRVWSFSYFESEGDRVLTLPGVLSEDGIWSLIRIDPGKLPVGKIRIVPGAEHRRLHHRPATVEEAEASLGDPKKGLRTYRLHYPGSGRILEIDFQADFPHIIEGWRETGEGSTTAVRTHTIRNAYWKHNSPDDLPLRKELGLR